MRRVLALAMIALAVAGCASSRPPSTASIDGKSPHASDARDREAFAAVRDMERQLAEIAALPAHERVAREAKLGRALEKLVDVTRGTKHHNRALDWLAAWRIDYARGDGADALLDELDHAEYLSFKQAGQLLRVRLRCQQGRVAEARAIADRLVKEVPELTIAQTTVGFYERVGAPAPRAAAKNLLGGPADPMQSRPEPWLVYLFVEGGEGLGLERLRTLLAELSDRRYVGKVRLVCVAFGANPVDSLGAINEAAAGRELDVLWPTPGDDTKRWLEQWSLPGTPIAALIGPDRSVMAADPEAATLRALIGKR